MGKRIYLPGEREDFGNYRRALAQLGGEVISTGEPLDCGGLLLPGGGDLDPAYYGEEPRGTEAPDPERDRREMELLTAFVKAGKPVLGICRGMQLLNVYCGGTLIQDLSGHSQIYGEDRLHPVCTVLGSRLYGLYGPEMRVNSAHHQAVSKVGEGLQVTQRAADGVIEALEHEALPLLGVQWHPERFGERGAVLLRAFLGEICP